jgi:hypothetical protein
MYHAADTELVVHALQPQELLMSVKEMPYYTVPAATLAEWIENQPDKWWSVDGDPWLTSRVDFPCPSDELGPMLRERGMHLIVRDRNATSTAHGELIKGAKLDELCDTRNRHHRKTLRLSWADAELDWLLMEDEALVP